MEWHRSSPVRLNEGYALLDHHHCDVQVVLGAASRQGVEGPNELGLDLHGLEDHHF